MMANENFTEALNIKSRKMCIVYGNCHTGGGNRSIK